MDNLRRFIIVVSIVLLFAFGICGLLLSSEYRNKTTNTHTENLSLDLPTFDPNNYNEDDVKSFYNNILIIVGDSNKPETELLMLLNIDSNTANINVMYIPKDLRYVNYLENTISTVGTIFRNRRTHTPAASSISIYESYLDIAIPYYIHFSTATFLDFMHTFAINGINFTIPTDLVYHDEYYNINLEKGTEVIKKDQILQLIQFYKTNDNSYAGELLDYYDGTDAKRLEMCRQFFDAFMQQTFINPTNEYFKLRFYDAFLPFISKCETNITTDLLSTLAPVFAKVQDSNIKYFTLNGEITYADRLYILYDQEAEGSFINMADGSKYNAVTGFKTYFPSNS